MIFNAQTKIAETQAYLSLLRTEFPLEFSILELSPTISFALFHAFSENNFPKHTNKRLTDNSRDTEPGSEGKLAA